MHAKLLAATGALLFSPLYAAFASSVNQIVVFGDSLSDNGNAAFALGGSIPGNYASNALTDGPNTKPATTGPLGLWIDQFAAKMSLPDPQPYLTNPISNTNYAVASAQTGSANPQDIGNQLTAFGVSHPLGAPSNALYAIWGGANDLFNGTSTGKTAADRLEANILTLSVDGAKNFLWLNLPNLGLTLRGKGNTGLSKQSADFDNQWTLDLAILKSGGINVIGVDINSLFNQIVAKPSAYGLQNVTDPSQFGPLQSKIVDPNTYLFWDQEHPTTAADAFIADAAFSDYNAPEPLSAGLALIGLGAVFAALKLRRKTATR